MEDKIKELIKQEQKNIERRIAKKTIVIVIATAIIFGTVGVAAGSFTAKDIVYRPNDNTWNVSNVSDAIDSIKFNKTADNYSTEEKVVGTWIDGKPLYQKTVTGVSFSVSANWTNLPSSPSNIEQVKNIVLYQDNGFCIFNVKGAQYWNGNIRVITADSLSSMTGYTVQYTKTTDTATTN